MRAGGTHLRVFLFSFSASGFRCFHNLNSVGDSLPFVFMIENAGARCGRKLAIYFGA